MVLLAEKKGVNTREVITGLGGRHVRSNVQSFGVRQAALKTPILPLYVVP